MAPISLAQSASTLLAQAAHSVESAARSVTHNTQFTASRTLSSLARRQTIVAVPETYGAPNPGPSPGIIVGIVLGTVGGVVLVLLLVYLGLNLGSLPGRSALVEDVEVRRSSDRSRSEPRSSARRSRTRSEVIEVRSPPRARRSERERVRETIILEESRRDPPPPIDEDDEDVVEVIEEHSPPPRRHSRRVSSGYRNVDPDAFAGGDRPLRKVRR